MCGNIKIKASFLVRGDCFGLPRIFNEPKRVIDVIKDVTGIELTPGRGGADCLGNGLHSDAFGNEIECCCDECDYFSCCYTEADENECDKCSDFFSPNPTQRKNKDFLIFVNYFNFYGKFVVFSTIINKKPC